MESTTWIYFPWLYTQRCGYVAKTRVCETYNNYLFGDIVCWSQVNLPPYPTMTLFYRGPLLVRLADSIILHLTSVFLGNSLLQIWCVQSEWTFTISSVILVHDADGARSVAAFFFPWITCTHQKTSPSTVKIVKPPPSSQFHDASFPPMIFGMNAA